MNSYRLHVLSFRITEIHIRIKYPLDGVFGLMMTHIVFEVPRVEGVFCLDLAMVYRRILRFIVI
jgi:hypothetical protein